MSFSNLSFDSAVSSLQPRPAACLPFTNHYLRGRFNVPARDSQGDRITVSSLLHKVVDQRRNLSISHQKLVKEKRYPVKLQRIIQVSPTDVRYRILDDAGEETKPRTQRDSDRVKPPSAVSPVKDLIQEPLFSERLHPTDRSSIPVHNLNREIRLFSKLKTPSKPRHSASHTRPKSELRLRKQTYSRANSPEGKKWGEYGDGKGLPGAILVQGSRCQYIKRITESGAKREDRNDKVDMWPVDASKIADPRSDKSLLSTNLKKYFRTGEARRCESRGLQKSRGAASFTVFDMDSLGAGKKSNASFDRIQSSNGFLG